MPHGWLIWDGVWWAAVRVARPTERPRLWGSPLFLDERQQNEFAGFCSQLTAPGFLADAGHNFKLTARRLQIKFQFQNEVGDFGQVIKSSLSLPSLSNKPKVCQDWGGKQTESQK